MQNNILQAGGAHGGRAWRKGVVMQFPVITIDPPWEFKVWTAKGGHKSASAHYDTQGTDWLCSLPVAEVAADNCVLLMWACWPTLPDALRVIEAYGITYKTLAFNWIKTYAHGGPQMKLGYYTRANSEPCLLATRGKPKRLDKGVSQVLACGTGRHSEKPFEFYERVERLLEGPYLELFARPHGDLIDGSRPGWTRLGNEIDGLDMTEALEHVAAAPQEVWAPTETFAVTIAAEVDLFAAEVTD
ncbi:MAG TPA: MT-A70 family methyltransferase [Bryobacteraceae bacterium]|nr:MT-A70 family methyltransferase [Bryobacteraceae bacterium]